MAPEQKRDLERFCPPCPGYTAEAITHQPSAQYKSIYC